MKFRFASIICLAVLASLFGPWPVRAASREHAVCGRATGSQDACFAKVYASPDGTVAPAATPSGYSPSQLRTAYSLPASGAAGKVAIVDAYGDPGIKSDLDAYSRHFGLPVMPSCSSGSQAGCFEKLDQSAGTAYPKTDVGWALETALDVEAVHAVCVGCRIELIEAKSATTTNLMAAVDEAVATGAKVVSMSWGGDETASETAQDAHFKHTGVIFMAASGDNGYGTSYPAASPKVVAVGGTHLRVGATGRTSETAWTEAGSGCSLYESKPSWQKDAGCSGRTIADIAADADPATGMAVYSSRSDSGAGWFVVGGTSLSTPLIAGMEALSGSGAQSAMLSGLYASLGTSRLYDVKSGTTGTCGTYLCKAAAGYDGPTGVGAPIGLSAL